MTKQASLITDEQWEKLEPLLVLPFIFWGR